MDSIESLQPGTELNNDQLTELFKCSTQGGMRRSKTTNTLVIVANHVKSVYSDRWEDGVFHYTGMGWTGDQSLDFMQNKTLAESASNGVSVHLFEVHRAKVYTYVGEVILASSPYQEDQVDGEGNGRKVWVFPVKPKTGAVPAVAIEVVRELDEQKAKEARALTDDEVAERARRTGRAKVGVRAATVQQHQRSPYVAEHAKRRAKGICELCKRPAPFSDKSGKPYLETHHIVWLARGGEDTIENTVALCPNCHKRMHVLDKQKDRDALLTGPTQSPQKHVPFFSLQKPSDLFKKMRADLDRLEQTQDAYDAFNFFVTAEHLPDWLGRRDLVSSSGILKVVGDIASGAKHFMIDAKRHNYVAAAKQQVSIELRVEDDLADVFVRLRVRLDKAGQKELKKEEIDVVELGRAVIDYWSGHITER